MIPAEKLGAACFVDNVKRFSDFQLEPEKYNLYRGLTALAETIEALLHVVHKVEMQLAEANHKIDVLSRR